MFILRATRLLLGALLCAAACLASPTAARADSGDGSLACNRGEICFKERAADTSVGLKQFWQGANHWQQEGCQVCHGPYLFYGTGDYVMDGATDFWNRDTQCRVYLWDVDAYGNWYWYAFANPGLPGYDDLPSYRNNGHSRCTSTVAPRNL